MLPIDKTYLKTNLINWKNAILDPAYIIQKTSLPAASADNVNAIYQYIGETTIDYTHSYFYECVANGTDPETYSWQRTNVQPQQTDVLQMVTSLPIAAADLVGDRKLYVGIDDDNLKHGGIYECQSDDSTGTTVYTWVCINDVGAGGDFLETIDELPSVASVDVGKQYFLSADTITEEKGHVYESDGTQWVDITPLSKYKSVSFLTMTGAKYQCITGLKLGGAYLIEISYNMFIVRVLDNFGDQSQKKYGFEIELLGQNLNDTTNAFYNYPVYLNNFEDNALAPILAIYVSNGDRTNIRVTQISGVENNDFDFGAFYTSTPPVPFKKSTFYSAASMREAIAPLFNDNTSYNVGDIVWKRVNTSANSSRVHDNIELYRCIVAHSGSWSSAHFEKIQLCKDFKSGSKIFPGTLEEWEALSEAEQAEYDFIASPEEGNAAPFPKYFVISNSDVNVGESYYTDATNSFEVFKIVADTIFNDIDVSGKLTPYVGHATAYTTDSSGYPNLGVTTWVASACMEANGHPYIRIRIFTDNGREYRFQRSQDGIYTLAEVPEVKTISNPFTVNTGKATSVYETEALKQGRVVQFKVYIESFKNIASGTWNTLGTVVDAIKPAMETPLSMSDGRVINATALSRITPNGELQIWGTDALNTLSSRFSATYFSAD